MATHNDQSSFTADTVAYRRTFTDIPYAKEIFDIVKTIRDPSLITNFAKMRYPEMNAFFEARYLLTDRVLAKSKVNQVLELAAGLSPRGIIKTAKRTLNYVEMDLPEKCRIKEQVISELETRKIIEHRENLHLVKGNVRDKLGFSRAKVYLRRKPVAVICEGLLRYISLPDKKKMAENIHEILEEYGGFWITPDIELLNVANATPESAARYEEMATRTGLDVRPNLWHDIDHAYTFYSDLGFSIKEYSLLEVANDLTCPARLSLLPETIIKILSRRPFFVMKVK